MSRSVTTNYDTLRTREAACAARRAAITVHCMYCKHTETQPDSTAASDAMERHYWDEHYSQSDRDHLRSVGQKPERIGTKP